MKNTLAKKHRRRTTVLGFLTVGVLFVVGACLLFSRSGHFSFNPPVPHKPVFAAETTTYPTRLSVSGSKLVTGDGRAVLLQGLMPPDPAKLNRKGKFSRDFVQEMRDTGANVIRIPVHPEEWALDPDYLWRYLDPFVTWSGECGMYAIIDLHFIGNVETGAGDQMPQLNRPSKDFTLAFWRTVASYFRAAPHVIFEIVNEPQSISPAVWRTTATDISAAIRVSGANQLIVVGGVEFAKDLSWVLDEPVTDDNIAYAAHIYPSHPSGSWHHWFGDVSGKYPVLITEWGWMETPANPQTAYLVGNAASYGEPLLDYLGEHDAGWVACWYDDEWMPAMFLESSSAMTAYGKYVTERLAALRSDP